MKILIIVFYHTHLILHTKSLSKTSEQRKKKKRETERETEMEEEIIMTILSASSLKETYG